MVIQFFKPRCQHFVFLCQNCCEFFAYISTQNSTGRYTYCEFLREWGSSSSQRSARCRKRMLATWANWKDPKLLQCKMLEKKSKMNNFKKAVSSYCFVLCLDWLLVTGLWKGGSWEPAQLVPFDHIRKESFALFCVHFWKEWISQSILNQLLPLKWFFCSQ